MKRIHSIILLSLATSLCHAQPVSEFFETGPYDVGRTQTNPTVTNNRSDVVSWWNGLEDTPANVGWNTNGIWWSFAVFGAPQRTHSNPELFNTLAAADEIYIHVGVSWREVDPSLAGIVDPGVKVGLYLVPGMDVPEGQLGGWQYTWPFLGQFDTVRTKFGEIDPAVAPYLASSPTEFRDGDPFANPPILPPTEAERRANLVAYDMTAAIKAAIASGDIDENTPWGVVFFADEAMPFTANDPKWGDKRQTVLDGTYIVLETVTGVEASGWAGYPVDASGFVDTGDFLGMINVTNGDWVYSYSLGKYIYLPESLVGDNGAWSYLPQ